MDGTAPEIELKAARALLNVPAGATAHDLLRAFRAAAKRAHPDRPGGSVESFRAVVEAYHRLRETPPAPAGRAEPPPAGPGDAASLEIGPLLAMTGGEVDHVTEEGRILRIRLPAGLRSGDRVRVGEARLAVRVAGDDAMLVRGDDLWMTIQVPARTLARGGRVSLETPLGERTVWVTRTAGGAGLVKLGGQGLPARGRHPQGHLFVRLAPKPGTESVAGALLRRFAAAWAA